MKLREKRLFIVIVNAVSVLIEERLKHLEVDSNFWKKMKDCQQDLLVAIRESVLDKK